MKAFFAALIILGALAFFFTDLPKEAAGRLGDAVRERTLPYLKNKTAAFLESTLSGKNKERSRPELMRAMETNLAELSLAINGKAKQAQDPKALIQETEALIAELKEQEEPRAFTKTAAAVAAKILPDDFVCPTPRAVDKKK